MAYNRTNQEKGKTTQVLPISEWIIAPGLHPGLVPSKQWIKAQESLERNKSKGYRKPRNNVALLTGSIYCACGARMYPKLTKRTTADGEFIYTYVCKRKELSKRELCSCRNANGNILDAAIVEQVKSLTDDNSSFVKQLAKSREFYTGKREQYEKQLADLQGELARNEKTIDGLIDSLGIMESTVVKKRTMQRIEELSNANQEIQNRIGELEGLTGTNTLADSEFDLLRQMLAVFRSCIDEMSVEEKRAAISTLVRKVIWDGGNAHVVLFGADEGEVEFPDMGDRITHMDTEGDEEETLEAFLDVDYEDVEEDTLAADSKTPWGENRK